MVFHMIWGVGGGGVSKSRMGIASIGGYCGFHAAYPPLRSWEGGGCSHAQIL